MFRVRKITPKLRLQAQQPQKSLEPTTVEVSPSISFSVAVSLFLSRTAERRGGVSGDFCLGDPKPQTLNPLKCVRVICLGGA